MALLSMRTRKRFWDVALAAVVAGSAWLLQVTVLNNLAFNEVFCNLPLALTILWGFVWGSPLPTLSAEDLKFNSAGEIFFRQLLGGSLAGALMGGFIAALYSSMLPIYPIAYPLAGWIAGYFSLPKLNQETLVCIPVVLLGTVLAEMITATQLTVLNYGGAFQHLAHLALPEALMNALIAPFAYFPMRRWYDFDQAHEAPLT